MTKPGKNSTASEWVVCHPPKADLDLAEQSFYLAEEDNSELGHRFLTAAQETFNLLAQYPHLGWQPNTKNRRLTNLRIFRVSGFEKMLVLYRPVDHGVEILRVLHGSRNILAILRREGV